MEKEDLIKVNADLARMMNYKRHADTLVIPVFKDLKVLKSDNPKTILMAAKDGFIEQLVSDGYIGENEFEDRINLVIENTKKFMRDNKFDNVDNSFIFYKDYNNGVFDFKLYVQDVIMSENNKIIRTFTAFFVEPKLHDFYQLSFSAGPFPMPTELLKPGVIDLKDDKITIILNNIMNEILSGIKYK